MPKITFMPNEELCPNGMEVDAIEGQTICDVALKNGIKIEHACEKSCACTTCHVYIRQGIETIDESSENEDDMLDKAWGLEQNSRLGCQVYPVDEMTVIRIPKYTINLVSEDH